MYSTEESFARRWSRRAVTYESIPAGADARQEWLLEEWKKVDDFIVSHSGAEAGPADATASAD